MKKLHLLCSTAACLIPGTAFAQSTGTVDFESETIVVTGTRVPEVGGVQAPDTSKPRAVLTQEMIARQNPGQTILDTINLVPGVSFQNNDAYGSSGGNLNIRGFDSTRISLTFDGIPLNDSGNYAIYSNQQLDPELIDNVNVSLGTTDVDSPTASAVGGTVNYRTMTPTPGMNSRILLSVGQHDFRRVFGVLNLGAMGPWGTRAFIAASKADNQNPFNNYSKVDKQQYNARVWQPLGAGGDFVSISGHYNQNRNNFFGSLPLRTDRDVPSGYPTARDERFYEVDDNCRIDEAQAGAVDRTNSCGTPFERRYNPSNTGNIRGSSRFTVTNSVTLTVDPFYQYVKANGGGTVRGREGIRTIGGVAYTGFIGGQYYFGRDLNGDGDVLDTCNVGASCSSSDTRGVTLLAPSQTRTHRYGVIAGARWDITPDHALRFSFTHDNADHRQTGQVGFLEQNGEPSDVFAINDPIQDARGNDVQKRDRQSYAILNQLAGEYRGEFGAVTVNAGLRAPFFKRDLENYCFTTSASGFLDCFGQDSQLEQAYAQQFPTRQGPQRRVFKYDKLLPNVGAVYSFSPGLSAFASFAQGLSVPGTDTLYNSFFFPAGTAAAFPSPETTDTFDGGARFRSSKIQAQAGVWMTKYQNRIATAYDPELDQFVSRNLGKVDKYGIDGSLAWAPMRELTLYTFGSWNKSKIKENLQIEGGGGFDCGSADPNSVTGLRNCAFTAGRREAGTPKYTYGASVLGKLGAFDLGVTAKRTGSRFVYDTNRAVFTGDVDNLGDANPANDPVQIYNAKAPAYWLVNLDVRYNLATAGIPGTYVQFNVYNLFDKFYVGGFRGGLNQGLSSSGFFANPPFVQIGAPRTASLTFNVGL